MTGDDAKKWEGVALIGDDIEADLGGAASEVGLWRVLGESRCELFELDSSLIFVAIVKTGKYQQGDETRVGLYPPDEVQSSFAAFIDDLVKHRN